VAPDQGHFAALATSLALVALVTRAVFAARTFAPVLSLDVLYLLAVVAVAVLSERKSAIKSRERVFF
jgi:hypothetical protein